MGSSEFWLERQRDLDRVVVRVDRARLLEILQRATDYGGPIEDLSPFADEIEALYRGDSDE